MEKRWMNIIRLPLRDLWYIFSILDNIINHCHSQCEKYIRCHLFFTKLSGFFSDVIFKIYTPVLFHIIKSPLLITEELSNMTLKKKFRTAHMHTTSFTVNHWKKNTIPMNPIRTQIMIMQVITNPSVIEYHILTFSL